MAKLDSTNRTRILLDRGLRGWVYNTAIKNYWRVAGWMEVEDLVQDGHLLFWKIRRENQPDLVERKAFMAYFQRAYLNHINDLSNKRTGLAETTVSQIVVQTEDGNPLDIWEVLGSSQHEVASFSILLEQAPKAIKDLVALFTTEEGLQKLRQHKHRRWHPDRRDKLPTRETTNSMLKRVLGIEAPDFDLIGATREFFRYE